jgi:hypothetical protein
MDEYTQPIRNGTRSCRVEYELKVTLTRVK